MYTDTACVTGDSHGQHYTETGCLDKCDREGDTFCTFAEGYNLELIVGCGTDPDCCIGTDICAVEVDDINAKTYRCIPTPHPTTPSYVM